MDAVSRNRMSFTSRRTESYCPDVTGLSEEEALEKVEDTLFADDENAVTRDLVIGCTRILLAMVQAESFKAMDMCCMLFDTELTPIPRNEMVTLFAYCKKEHERGRLAASLFLGLMYSNGFGVATNHSEAFDLLKVADDGGIIFAAAEIGWLYEKTEHYSEACQYYQKGADKGHIWSMNALAQMYRKGLGVKKNYLEAFNYYLKPTALDLYSAGESLWEMTTEIVKEMAFSPALVETLLKHISQLDSDEYAIAEFYEAAFEYCLELAEQEKDDELFTILSLVVQLIDQEKTDPHFAVFVVTHLKKLDWVPFASSIIGQIYALGEGNVARDPVEAFKYYKKAEEHKINPMVPYNLGMLCLEINGLDALGEAQQYIEKANNTGLPTAKIFLAGRFFEKKDELEKAMMFYKIAAEQNGDEEAKNRILTMFLTGKAVKLDPEFTKRFLQDVALEEDEFAEKAKSKLAEINLNRLKRSNDGELSVSIRKMRFTANEDL